MRFLLYFLSLSIFAQDLNNVQKAQLAADNFVSNGGVEKTLNGWTGGIWTQTTTTANVRNGLAAAACDFTAASQFCTMPNFTIPSGGLGNCSADFWYKGGGTANVTAYVETAAGSKVSSDLTISSASAAWQRVSIQFACNESSATNYRIELASTGNSAVIYIDDVRAGSNLNIGSVAQAFTAISGGRVTSSQTISSTSETTIIWNGASINVDSILNTSTGVVTIARAGNYLVNSQIFLANATLESYVVRVKKNSTTVCERDQSEIFSRLNPSCLVEAVRGDTISVTVDSTSDASYDIAAGAASTINIEYFDTASGQVFRVGAPGLEWTAYTPAFVGSSNGLSWTNSTPAGFYKCSGDTLDVTANISFSGLPTTGTGYFLIGVPSGFTMDTTKMGASAANQALGSALALDAGSIYYRGVVVYDQATRVKIQVNDSGNEMSNTNPFSIASGDRLTVSFSVPVTASSPCPRAPMPPLSNAVTSTNTQAH